MICYDVSLVLPFWNGSNENPQHGTIPNRKLSYDMRRMTWVYAGQKYKKKLKKFTNKMKKSKQTKKQKQTT